MSRRSTPERLHAARRIATLNRLIGDGELPDRAEMWIQAWEAEAGRRGLGRDGRLWEFGWDWIQECRSEGSTS
jgi:hypothetical protein